MELIRFSESFSIAIHGMAWLSNIHPEKITGKRLAHKIKAHENTLAKVFQKLVRAGLVESVRGPKGGFYIRESKMDISFLDIFEAVEGDLSRQTCPMGREHCPFSDCVLGKDILTISGDLKKLLSEKRLSDFSGRRKV